MASALLEALLPLAATSISASPTPLSASLPHPLPPYPVHVCGGRALVWSRPVVAALRLQHRIVGECPHRIGPPPPRRRRVHSPPQPQLQSLPPTPPSPPPPLSSSAEDVEPVEDEEGEGAEREVLGEEAGADAGLDGGAAVDAEVLPIHSHPLPVHLSAAQAEVLMRLRLIRLVDGDSIAALRQCRFGCISDEERVVASAQQRLRLLHQQRGTSALSASPPSTADVASSSASSAPPSPYPSASTAALAALHFPSHPLAFTLPALLSGAGAYEPPMASAPLHLSSPSPPEVGCVYVDLYSRGYTATSASHYGGDFLLYDADPGRVHAHSLLTVRTGGRGERRGERLYASPPSIHALELLTLARTCSGARKSLVTAWVDGGRTDGAAEEHAATAEEAELQTQRRSVAVAEVCYLTWGWEPALSKSR